MSDSIFQNPNLPTQIYRPSDGRDDANEYLCVMNNKVIKELFRENLCTHFILPLLKLNKFKFINESNFVDSYLSVDKKYILVEVLETLFFEHRLEMHPDYDGIYKSENGKSFVVYKIPSMFRGCVENFCLGKFFDMREESKQLIYKYSGLVYGYVNEEGGVITDIRLLALSKSVAVKNMWEVYLNEWLDESKDYLPIPSEKSFMSMDTVLKMTVEV